MTTKTNNSSHSITHKATRFALSLAAAAALLGTTQPARAELTPEQEWEATAARLTAAQLATNNALTSCPDAVKNLWNFGNMVLSSAGPAAVPLSTFVQNLICEGGDLTLQEVYDAAAQVADEQAQDQATIDLQSITTDIAREFESAAQFDGMNFVAQSQMFGRVQNLIQDIQNAENHLHGATMEFDVTRLDLPPVQEIAFFGHLKLVVWNVYLDLLARAKNPDGSPPTGIIHPSLSAPLADDAWTTLSHLEHQAETVRKLKSNYEVKVTVYYSDEFWVSGLLKIVRRVECQHEGRHPEDEVEIFSKIYWCEGCSEEQFRDSTRQIGLNFVEDDKAAGRRLLDARWTHLRTKALQFATAINPAFPETGPRHDWSYVSSPQGWCLNADHLAGLTECKLSRSTQAWFLDETGQLRAAEQSRRCLEFDGSGIMMGDCDEDTDTVWFAEDDTLRPVSASDLCLSRFGPLVSVVPCGSELFAQTWYFFTNFQAPSDSVTAPADGFCLGAGAADASSDVYVGTCQRARADQWYALDSVGNLRLFKTPSQSIQIDGNGELAILPVTENATRWFFEDGQFLNQAAPDFTVGAPQGISPFAPLAVTSVATEEGIYWD